MELDTRLAKEKADSARMFLAGFADTDFGEFAATIPFCHRYLATALDHIEELSAMVLNLADRVTPNAQDQPTAKQCPKAGVRYKRERPTEEQMERIAKSDLAKCHDTVLVWVNEGDLVSWDWDEMPNGQIEGRD